MLSVEVYQITQTLKIKEDIGHSKKKGGGRAGYESPFSGDENRI